MITSKAMNTDAPHILVVDDDQRLRQLLRKFLSEKGFLVTAAACASDARLKMDSLQFDLIVLDVMMPGESGLDFAAHVRREGKAPVLMLTAMGEAKDRIAGLERGADDYLPKPFEPMELLLRINAILRRAQRPPSLAKAFVRMGDFSFDPLRCELRRKGKPVRLTEAEAMLLKALAEQPGGVFSRESLMGLASAAGGERAIDVQVTRLRRKIEPDPKLPRYLKTVRGKGYVLHPD